MQCFIDKCDIEYDIKLSDYFITTNPSNGDELFLINKNQYDYNHGFAYSIGTNSVSPVKDGKSISSSDWNKIKFSHFSKSVKKNENQVTHSAIGYQTMNRFYNHMLFHSGINGATILYRDLVFISGGSSKGYIGDKHSNVLEIFEKSISSSYGYGAYPPIARYNTNHDKLSSMSIGKIILPKKYGRHGMIMLDVDEEYEIDKIKNINIKLLLFGGMCHLFSKSFLIVNIKIEYVYDPIGRINFRYSKPKIEMTHQFEKDKIVNDKFFSFDDKKNKYTNTNVRNTRNDSESAKKLHQSKNDNNKTNEKNSRKIVIRALRKKKPKKFDRIWDTFTYHFFDKRYLIMIGNANEHILYFDFDRLKWIKSQVKLAMNIESNISLMNEKDNKIYLFGRQKMNKQETKCFCWHFNVESHLKWSQQRIIWIAYYKNGNNKHCLMYKLPKDLIKQIVTYLLTPAIVE